MRRPGRPAALLASCAAALVALSARAEEARPGRTLVLDHGTDPALVAGTSGGASRDGRLHHPLPRAAPVARVLVATTGARPRGPVVDAVGRIVVGTVNGMLIVSPDGTETRSVLADALDCPPVVVPGGDFVALSREGRLVRATPEGTVIARAPSTGLSVRSAPLVEADGSLVVVAGRTLAEVGSDLEVRRTLPLPDGPALSPARTREGRWVVVAGSEVVLVEPRRMELLRSWFLPGRAATPPAVAGDGTIWVATVDGDLVHVTHETRLAGTISLGGRLPEAASSERTMLGVAPDGDVLAVVPTRGLVRVAPDGTERWVWAGDTPLVGAASVDAYGRAAVLDRVGHLAVIDPSGALEWTFALGSLPLGGPVVTAEGRVVVVTERGVEILGP